MRRTILATSFLFSESGNPNPTDHRTASKLCNWNNTRDSGYFLLPLNNNAMKNDSDDDSFYSDDGESSPLRKFKGENVT